MHHILFLGQVGFFKKDFDRFYIKKLSKHFKVTFIDLSNLSNKKFYNSQKKNFFKCKQLIKVNSLKEFNKILKIKKFICAFDLSPGARKLDVFRKFLSDQNIKLVNMQLGLVPEFKRNLILKIKYFLKLLCFNQSLLKFYLKRLPILFSKKNSSNINYAYDYIFCSGDKIKVNKNSINENTKFIYGRSFDYETFLKNKSKKVKKNFLLFIDQSLHNHNGYKLRNIPPFVTEIKYYKSLNNFFSLLEKKFKTEIIIAAHPRSNYKVTGNKFNNRKIIHYTETNKYVARCLAVINYTSTAMGFAVMNKKPIIFYTSDEIKNSHDANYVDFLSNQLGANLNNIDDINSINTITKKVLKVDKNKYKKYFYNYIYHHKSNQKTNLEKIFNIINESH